MIMIRNRRLKRSQMKLSVTKNAILGLMLFAFGALYAQDDYSGKESTKSHEEIYFIVEERPVFTEGGDSEGNDVKKYISENLVYPNEAKEKGITGRVYVRFVVGSDGFVRETEVISGVDPILNKEAFRIIGSMPRWAKPGKQGGKPVAVSIVQRVDFVL